MNEYVKKAIDAVENAALEPIKSAILTRLSNPFFPSVLISWLILNWERVFIILFAKIDILEKIDRVKSLPSSDYLWGVDIPHALTIYYPLFFGVLYVVLTPFISYVLFFCHNNVINKLYDSRVRGKAANILSEVSLIEAEQKKTYAKDLFNAKYQAEVEDQNTRRRQSQSTRIALIEEEENLKKSLATQNKELNDLREVLQSSRNELTSLNKAIQEKQAAMLALEQSRDIPVGSDIYNSVIRQGAYNSHVKDFKFLPEDKENPGWVVGWIIYDSSKMKFHSIYGSRDQAEMHRNIEGGSFAVAYGTHKLGSDEFIFKEYSSN